MRAFRLGLRIAEAVDAMLEASANCALLKRFLADI